MINSDIKISVLICTRNPKFDYLTRVLDSIRHQTFDMKNWELILIDNCSEQPLEESIDLTWHPKGRHVREDELGLTPARLRGISEAMAELLVFVDDDNVLDPNYLEQAMQISQDYPYLGTWGGSAIPEFEVHPEPWVIPFLPYLAIRQCKRNCWSNLLTYNESLPNGAGICVRRVVAERYAAKTVVDRSHRVLGRKGDDLVGGEDYALIFTGCEIGLGTGSMVALKLTHLISANRLTKVYILKLIERAEFTMIILNYIFEKNRPLIVRVSFIRRLIGWFRNLVIPKLERDMMEARMRGRIEAQQTISYLSQISSDQNQACKNSNSLSQF